MILTTYTDLLRSEMVARVCRILIGPVVFFLTSVAIVSDRGR